MKYLLGVLVLALTAVLVVQWRDWPASGGDPGAGLELDGGSAPVESEPLSPADLLDPPLEKEDYVGIIERPLFLPNRRPPVAEPEIVDSPEEPPGLELDSLDLTAIVITPAESVAWVRSPSKPTPEKLRPGDELDGWTVKAIAEDAIELERQGESNTLVLRDYANSPPKKARPPNRAATAPNPARGGPRGSATGQAGNQRPAAGAKDPSR